MQSLLTGLLYVDMVFKPESPPRYVDFETGEPQLPTAPTGLEAIMERMSEVDLQSIIQNADQTLRAVSSLLANPETQRVPANINATLADVRTLIANTDRQVALIGSPRCAGRFSPTARWRCACRSRTPARGSMPACRALDRRWPACVSPRRGRLRARSSRPCSTN
jgi:hypothetical protein